MRTLFVGLLVVSSLNFARSPAHISSPQARRMAPATAMSVSVPAWEDLEGVASWYSAGDPGVVPWTASTEPFNDRALTCAMWGVPFHTRLRVTNLGNGRSVVVRVNDRGPAEDLVLTQNRVLDLTKAAFATIADPGQGLIRVRVQLDQPLLSSTH